MKAKIKKIIMQKLHAIEGQRYDVVEAIASRGVPGFAELNYDDLKNDVLRYIETLKVAPFSYKYAASCSGPCLYGSIYAVMIEGLLGRLQERSQSELQEWADYLNSFQRKDDGLYYDSQLAGAAFEHQGAWNEGWGKHHLMGHMIIALARLGVTPKYPLKYLEKYYNSEYLRTWMEGFDFAGNVWTVSNYFMNLYTVLQYVRDYMNEKRAGAAVDAMAEWLLKRQNSHTGMWHSQPMEQMDIYAKLNVLRAAYHFYPLFEYEGIEIPYQKEIVDFILPLQNSWGGWTVEHANAGACEDIDALEPLIRCAASSPKRSEEIKSAVKRSIIWQLSSRNADRGFSFYVRAAQEYGGHPLTSSRKDESSLFATWFRVLCLAYEMRYMGMEQSFDIGHYPGYEIK